MRTSRIHYSCAVTWNSPLPKYACALSTYNVHTGQFILVHRGVRSFRVTVFFDMEQLSKQYKKKFKSFRLYVEKLYSSKKLLPPSSKSMVLPTAYMNWVTENYDFDFVLENVIGKVKEYICLLNAMFFRSKEFQLQKKDRNRKIKSLPDHLVFIKVVIKNLRYVADDMTNFSAQESYRIKHRYNPYYFFICLALHLQQISLAREILEAFLFCIPKEYQLVIFYNWIFIRGTLMYYNMAGGDTSKATIRDDDVTDLQIMSKMILNNLDMGYITSELGYRRIIDLINGFHRDGLVAASPYRCASFLIFTILIGLMENGLYDTDPELYSLLFFVSLRNKSLAALNILMFAGNAEYNFFKQSLVVQEDMIDAERFCMKYSHAPHIAEFYRDLHSEYVQSSIRLGPSTAVPWCSCGGSNFGGEIQTRILPQSDFDNENLCNFISSSCIICLYQWLAEVFSYEAIDFSVLSLMFNVRRSFDDIDSDSDEVEIDGSNCVRRERNTSLAKDIEKIQVVNHTMYKFTFEGILLKLIISTPPKIDRSLNRLLEVIVNDRRNILRHQFYEHYDKYFKGKSGYGTVANNNFCLLKYLSVNNNIHFGNVDGSFCLIDSYFSSSKLAPIRLPMSDRSNPLFLNWSGYNIDHDGSKFSVDRVNNYLEQLQLYKTNRIPTLQKLSFLALDLNDKIDFVAQKFGTTENNQKNEISCITSMMRLDKKQRYYFTGDKGSSRSKNPTFKYIPFVSETPHVYHPAMFIYDRSEFLSNCKLTHLQYFSDCYFY